MKIAPDRLSLGAKKRATEAEPDGALIHICPFGVGPLSVVEYDSAHVAEFNY